MQDEKRILAEIERNNDRLDDLLCDLEEQVLRGASPADQVVRDLHEKLRQAEQEVGFWFRRLQKLAADGV